MRFQWDFMEMDHGIGHYKMDQWVFMEMDFNGIFHEKSQGKHRKFIWQCVKTNSTPVVHIKIAGIYGCSFP